MESRSIEPIVWRIVKNCKFVGYIVSYSLMEAQIKAKEKYGTGCLVESSIELNSKKEEKNNEL